MNERNLQIPQIPMNRTEPSVASPLDASVSLPHHKLLAYAACRELLVAASTATRRCARPSRPASTPRRARGA